MILNQALVFEKSERRIIICFSQTINFQAINLRKQLIICPCSDILSPVVGDDHLYRGTCYHAGLIIDQASIVIPTPYYYSIL